MIFKITSPIFGYAYKVNYLENDLEDGGSKVVQTFFV